MAKTLGGRGAILIRNAAIGFSGLLGVILLLRLVWVRNYDYDELSHAHMTWLVSIGEVPYRDFAANHFPFLWILLSPVMWVLPHSPLALVMLRSLALVLNLVFIGALYKLISAEQPPKERIWTMVCFGMVVFCPLVMHFLIEFRPDAVANALLFSTLAWLWLRGSRSVPAGLAGGFCVGVALLVNTKYIPFLFLLGPVALVMNAGQFRRIWPFTLAICLGFSMAILGGFLLLVWIGVSLHDAWQMVVAYNEMAQKAHPFGFGLIRALMEYPAWFAYGLAGLIGCTVLFLRQRRSPGLLIIAIGVFLLMDLFITTKPWKQYIASWLLLAACLPARLLPPFITRLGPPAQTALALCVLTLAGVEFAETGIKVADSGSTDRATQDRVIAWTSRNVPEDGFVVSSYFLHPIFRRDAFFKTVYDVAPGRDDGLEEFMPRLTQPPYSEHFQPAGYEKDLEAHPPAAIILNTHYTSAQAHVLDAYLTRHADVYTLSNIPDTSIFVMQRQPGQPEKEK